MPHSYDVIVVGAGHNGLTSAAFLARAGLRVLVLEKNEHIGGATVSRSLYSDWIYSNCSYVCSLLRPEIYRALDLARFGLQVTPYGGSATFLENGDVLGRYWNSDRAHAERRRHSPHDADAYPAFAAAVQRQCLLIREFLLRPPADPFSPRWRNLVELWRTGRRLGALGADRLADTYRFLTMSVSDYLDEFFESDVIKASLAGSGIIGTALGPRSPGTSYVLLHHYMGDVDGNMGAWGFARGGMGAVSTAIAGALQAAGGEIRTGADVVAIRTRGRRITGVALASGEEIAASVVVSALDLKRTFLHLTDNAALPGDFLHRVRNFRTRGSSGKLNIALDAMPSFPALPPGHELLAGDLHFVDSIERLERAYDDYKAGRWSADPYLDLLIPTLTDPTMAPPGKHYMSVFVQYCPAKLATGDWTDADKAAFEQTVVDQIARFSPDFRDKILHIETRTPRELEAEVGLTDGNIFQGELTLDQLMFNRPVPGYARYRTPLAGLYLAGSTAHPGGGVMAAPGANAAREILADLRRGNTVPDSFGDD